MENRFTPDSGFFSPDKSAMSSYSFRFHNYDIDRLIKNDIGDGSDGGQDTSDGNPCTSMITTRPVTLPLNNSDLYRRRKVSSAPELSMSSWNHHLSSQDTMVPPRSTSLPSRLTTRSVGVQTIGIPSIRFVPLDIDSDIDSGVGVVIPDNNHVPRQTVQMIGNRLREMARNMDGGNGNAPINHDGNNNIQAIWGFHGIYPNILSDVLTGAILALVGVGMVHYVRGGFH